MSHNGISDETYSKYKGRFVAFFRQPEQRAISSYYCFGESADNQYGWADVYHKGKRAWAEAAEGTVARMLTSENAPAEMGHSPPYDRSKPPDMKKALDRLQSGLMFVGLTEFFELSVCLFHAKFGGECLPVEFGNMRPGSADNKNDKGSYDTSELGGYTDPYDSKLYAAAKMRFWNELSEYNVSYGTCKTVICPRAAESFSEEIRDERRATFDTLMASQSADQQVESAMKLSADEDAEDLRVPEQHLQMIKEDPRLAANEQECVKLGQYEYIGGDLPHGYFNQTHDVRACGEICEKTAGCESFTFWERRSACRLSNAGATLHPVPGNWSAMTGRRGCHLTSQAILENETVPL